MFSKMVRCEDCVMNYKNLITKDMIVFVCLTTDVVAYYYALQVPFFIMFFFGVDRVSS